MFSMTNCVGAHNGIIAFLHKNYFLKLLILAHFLQHLQYGCVINYLKSYNLSGFLCILSWVPSNFIKTSHAVHLKYTQLLLVSYTSVKPGENSLDRLVNG